ncbi:MAG: hypothetical protein JWO05_1510 [Gemmatimonadetes bacterium]|nr:hypothetical protein [Gemmatimonadota bacterium]
MGSGRMRSMLLLLVAICGIGKVVHDSRQAQARRGWQVTRGLLRSSRIDVDFSSRRTMYVVDLAYPYVVNGRTYTGTQLRPDYSRFRVRSELERAMAPFAVGESLNVFYNPLDPEESALIRVGRSSPGVLLLVILAFLVASFVLWKQDSR